MSPFRHSLSFGDLKKTDLEAYRAIIAFVVLLLLIGTAICVSNSWFTPKCGNKLHTNWTNLAADQYKSFVHPTPRKEILNLFEVDNKRGKSTRKFCIDCVIFAEGILSSQQVSFKQVSFTYDPYINMINMGLGTVSGLRK